MLLNRHMGLGESGEETLFAIHPFFWYVIVLVMPMTLLHFDNCGQRMYLYTIPYLFCIVCLVILS